MARRRRPHASGHVNNERWLLTYADMITLLLALFIILFSISTISKVKFSALAHEMAKGGFGSTEAENRPPPEKKVAEDTQSLNALAAALRAYINQRHLTQNVAVHIEKRGVVVSLRTDSAMFKSGSAVLEPQAGRLIHAIAGFLRTPAQRERMLKIEGNTDDVPISTPLYPTNWELSTSRAVAVTRHLSEHDGIAPQRLAAIGFSEWHPFAPNTSEENRLLNRRVDIVVLRLTD
ncbi:MAG: flagellar motor protein MotB [Candidatus Velthaea sp.]|jgi:chemotaxis protein MotB